MADFLPNTFLLIGITDAGVPMSAQERADGIAAALRTGAYHRVHLRLSTTEHALAVLRNIPSVLLPQISVHNATDAILSEFPDVGVHLTGTSPVAPSNFRATLNTLSCSCHSATDVSAIPADAAYAFLSPICDSISKRGYTAGFSQQQLKNILDGPNGHKLVALGGMSIDKIYDMQAIGFKGMAMLGNANL